MVNDGELVLRFLRLVERRMSWPDSPDVPTAVNEAVEELRRAALADIWWSAQCRSDVGIEDLRRSIARKETPPVKTSRAIVSQRRREAIDSIVCNVWRQRDGSMFVTLPNESPPYGAKLLLGNTTMADAREKFHWELM